MGYDLHITRRKYWTAKGDDITADEWLAYLRGDSELILQPEQGRYFAVWDCPSELDRPWLDWSDGQIYSKNPDLKLIAKMVSIARQLDAAVLGDDDEVYRANGQVVHEPKLSLVERLAAWLARRRRQRSVKAEHEPLPFGVGDTVRDLWGNEHLVIQIDPEALHGAGMIRTRRTDGTELGHMMTGHGLEPTRTRPAS